MRLNMEWHETVQGIGRICLENHRKTNKFRTAKKKVMYSSETWDHHSRLIQRLFSSKSGGVGVTPFTESLYSLTDELQVKRAFFKKPGFESTLIPESSHY